MSLQPPDEWTFKTPVVAEAFDQHVREQLPWYELTTKVVTHIARHYIPEGGLVYDIGASTGNIGLALAPTLEARNAHLVAVDNSPEMAKIYRGPGVFVVDDAEAMEYEPCDLVVCFLCLMFIRPRYRRALVTRLVDALNPGGALIIFDKSVPVCGYPSVVMQRLALAGKAEAGVPADEILKKELSLSGVQRPLERHEIPARAVEIFRFGDFAGWLIEKP